MNIDLVPIGDESYEQKAMPIQITKISNKENQDIIAQLIEYARAHKLQAISAPVLGINFRIIVFKIKNNYEAFINPVTINQSEEKFDDWENCLAVNSGKTFGLVPRPVWIEISGLDKQGKRFSLKLEGKLAASFQHQRDHLEAKFFMQRVRKSHLKYLVNKTEFDKCKNHLPKCGKTEII